ncbi:tautomerase family protein [Vagococcus intermedius]|uniref:Tautomerase family protein n=1 Tax=Vagococcus intermedius TaxID=2991418 RepID=A0AAF0CT45_9ENTE|nr:tautomerase family protein [Vagococcus intermedius]WEG72411.1 tautomerase family protein [Vagococcus intermedius]WEG74499.1 tautomerase family protein [Vagococcus intermedius]
MPLIKVSVVKGHDPILLKNMLDDIHNCVVKAFNVPFGDRYQVLNEIDESFLILEDTGLGFTRTSQRLLIEITSRQRSEHEKVTFYKLVNETLHQTYQINKQDIIISFTENGNADWSFSDGKAQFLTGDLI